MFNFFSCPSSSMPTLFIHHIGWLCWNLEPSNPNQNIQTIPSHEISEFWPSFQKFDQILQIWPNFTISTKFQNLDQISEFRPSFRILTKFQNFNQNFRISIKFHNVDQISEFWPNFTISTKCHNFNQNFRISTKFQNFN